jgi:hypothetical protein
MSFGEVDTGESQQTVGVDDIPESLRSSALHQAYIERFADGRDMRVIISADNSATGVGKTTLAVFLALLWDVWGWTAEKGTLDPREFSVYYDEVRPGSVMLLDEAEQAIDRRRSMTQETLAIGHDFATKRYRQIFGILTLPSKDMIDARIADKLCDYWILVEETGRASVFRFEENAFTGKVYYKKVETIEWPPLDGNPIYEQIEQKKHDRMTGKTQSRFVRRDEFEEALDNYWSKATAKRNYELINSMYEATQSDDSPVDLTQSQIGEIVGMSQSNVSKIVNTDEFEEFYKSHSDRSNP